MRYLSFVTAIEARTAGGLDQEQAAAAIDATLATLAQRLSSDGARRLGAQLPAELQRALHTGAPGQTFGVGVFLDRVARREGTSRSEASTTSRAVMAVLAEAVTGHELADVRAELGDDYAALFRAPAADHWPEARRHAPHP